MDLNLIRRAVEASGRPVPSAYPELNLGHLSDEQFAAVVQALDVLPIEMRTDEEPNPHDGRRYQVIQAWRGGLRFRAQRFAPVSATAEVAA